MLGKVINMKILESLSSQEAKKKFRELVKKYHPDVGGSTKTTKRITAAKDSGDNALIALHRELTGRKPKEEKEQPKKSKTDKEASRKQLHRWADMIKEGNKWIISMGSAFIEEKNNTITVRFDMVEDKKTIFIYNAERYRSLFELIKAFKEKM